MNSESEKRLSLDELRARNEPRTEPKPTPPEAHPTAREWDQMLRTLHALGRVLADQTILLEQLAGRQPPTWAQVETLTKELKTVGDLVERAGSESGKPSWRERLRLPEIPLPHWSTVLFVMVSLLSLGLICCISAMLWSGISGLLR